MEHNVCLAHYMSLHLRFQHIKRQMDENGLFSDHTMQSLLDELDVIEYYQQPSKTVSAK